MSAARICPPGVTVFRSIEPSPTVIRIIAGPVIITGGAASRPPPVMFSMATAVWIVNHNLGYVPMVSITDLAGNVINIEVTITATQIIVRPNAPATGYVHYY